MNRPLQNGLIAVGIFAIPVLVISAFEVVSARHPDRQDSKPNEQLIRRQDKPSEWPFTVDEGVLACVRNPLAPAMAAVIFSTNGKTYGINGGALTGNAYPEIAPIVERTDLGLYKVPLGGIIVDGLELCKKLPKDEQPIPFGMIGK